MNRKRLLFFHNTLPEYRVGFWNSLNKDVELIVAILEPELQSKVYGFAIGEIEFKIVYVNNNLNDLIMNTDAVILPPIDDKKCIFAALAIKKICRKQRIPYYFWTEKWEAPSEKTPKVKKIKNFIQRKIYAYCSKGAKKYIAAGIKAKEYLINIGISQKNIEIVVDSSTSPIGNAIDIRRKYDIDFDKKIILYLGRLIERKGCDVLIKSCKGYLKQWNAVLLICGDGEFADKCRIMADDHESIILAGKIQPYERRCYYQQSDVFILPSIIKDGVVEGWGLAINEALECGTPTITTTAVGAGYDLINIHTGIMIEENNEMELKNAIEDILKKGYDRMSIVEYYQSYSISNMAKNFARCVFTNS